MSTSRIVPASNTNHTYHSAGAGSPDYTAIATWEAATDVSLASGGYSLQLLPGTHNDSLNAAGSTNTDATHFRRLWVDPNDAHAGVIGAGVILANTSDNVSLYLNENYFQVHDLQVSPNLNSANNRYAAWLVNTGNQLVGVIVAGGVNAGAGRSYGVIASAAGCKIINSLVVGGSGSNDQADVRSTQTTGTPLLVANTTIIWNSSAVRGLLVGTANMCTAINVIADGYGTACFSGTFTASASNVSSDSSAPGTSPVTLADPAYVSAGTDYHLTAGDRAAIGVGADQSSSYTDDVDNDGTITTWYPGYDSLTFSLPTATIDSPPDSGEPVDAQILGGESINLLSSATGSETPYTHEWTIVEPGSGWDGASVADPGVTTFNVGGTWTIRYTVTDNLGNTASDERVLVVEFPSVPIADAGPSQNVLVGALVQLDGSGSSDPEGDPLTYLWDLSSKPMGSAATLSSETIVNPTFTVDLPGVYFPQLIVNDGFQDSAPSVAVITANAAPVADAGPDQVVSGSALVQLDGSGSSDPEGDPLTYLWEMVEKPAGSAATLSSETIVNPTFTVDLPGTYRVQLVVNDGLQDSPSSVVIVSWTEATLVPMFIASSRVPWVAGTNRKLAQALQEIPIERVWKFPKDLYDVAVNWEGSQIMPAGAVSLGALTVIVKDDAGSDVTSSLLVASGVEGLIAWAEIQEGTIGEVYDVIFRQTFNTGEVLEKYVQIEIRNPRHYVTPEIFKYPNDLFPITIQWEGRLPRAVTAPTLSSVATKAYTAIDGDESSTYVESSYAAKKISASNIKGGSGGDSRMLEVAVTFSNGRVFHEYATLTVRVPPA